MEQLVSKLENMSFFNVSGIKFYRSSGSFLESVKETTFFVVSAVKRIVVVFQL